MPSSMTDFLNTFLNLKQVQNQTEQIVQKSRSDAITGMSTFMQLAQHTADPTQLTGLVSRFAELGVGTQAELSGILAHVTPTQEALKSYMTTRGIVAADGNTMGTPTKEGDTLARETASTNLTGMNRGQVGASDLLSGLFPRVDTAGQAGDALATHLGARTAAGMTPFQMVEDAAGRALPSDEILQAAGIRGGTRMSAAQDAGARQGIGELNERRRVDTFNANYQIGMLDIDAARARATAMGRDPQIITNLIDAKNKLLSTVTDAQNKNPTRSAVLGFIGGLNAINSQMQALGLPNEGQIDYKPEDLVNPSFLSRLTDRRPVVVNPGNRQPAGSGRK